jgi:hypothetical protein
MSYCGSYHDQYALLSRSITALLPALYSTSAAQEVTELPANVVEDATLGVSPAKSMKKPSQSSDTSLGQPAVAFGESTGEEQ